MTRQAAAIAALFLSGTAAAAGAPPPESPASRAAAVAPRDERALRTAPSWFAFPVVFWLPETKLGFGATGGVQFHIRKAERASGIFLVGAYTMQRQGSADVAADLYLPRGFVVAARVRTVHFPDAFYGIGPSSPTDGREPFTRRFAEAVLNAEHPILHDRFRAGLRLDLRGEEISDLQAGGVLASGELPGTPGFRAVGLGGSVTWDTRDRPLFPRRGSFVQAWLLGYPSTLGSAHATFTRSALEGRTFLPLGRGRVLGAAAFVETASDETPFTLLPKLGSTRFLRGWREGRFRDRFAWAAQAELRLPLATRVYGAAFGAFGNVGRDLGSLRAANTLKVAGGLGLRWRLTEDGANVRLDFAVSEAGPEVYLLLLEAF
jgi:hypothetical protein